MSCSESGSEEAEVEVGVEVNTNDNVDIQQAPHINESKNPEIISKSQADMMSVIEPPIVPSHDKSKLNDIVLDNLAGAAQNMDDDDLGSVSSSTISSADSCSDSDSDIDYILGNMIVPG